MAGTLSDQYMKCSDTGMLFHGLCMDKDEENVVILLIISLLNGLLSHLLHQWSELTN